MLYRTLEILKAKGQYIRKKENVSKALYSIPSPIAYYLSKQDLEIISDQTLGEI
jgi:hypothetical protein